MLHFPSALGGLIISSVVGHCHIEPEASSSVIQFCEHTEFIVADINQLMILPNMQNICSVFTNLITGYILQMSS